MGADIAAENGGFRIKKIYTGEAWNPDLKAPLGLPNLDVKVGDYIVGVNGKPLNMGDNFYSYFEEKAGKHEMSTSSPERRLVAYSHTTVTLNVLN